MKWRNLLAVVLCPEEKRDYQVTLRPDGGIGRRARLRIWWSNPCGFESLSGQVIRRAVGGGVIGLTSA
jgi:hypothetical protein